MTLNFMILDDLIILKQRHINIKHEKTRNKHMIVELPSVFIN